MKIHQLSIFVENRPGHLTAPCQALAEAGINIVTLSLADTQQFGILRLIVRDWQRAQQVLQAAGIVASVTEVLAIEVPDQPGGLAKILTAVEHAQINVEYLYAFAERSGDKAALILRFDDPDRATKELANAGINVLSGVEVYGTGQ